MYINYKITIKVIKLMNIYKNSNETLWKLRFAKNLSELDSEIYKSCRSFIFIFKNSCKNYEKVPVWIFF